MKKILNSLAFRLALFQSLLVVVAFWALIEIYEQSMQREYSDFFYNAPQEQTNMVPLVRSRLENLYGNNSPSAFLDAVRELPEKLVLLDNESNLAAHSLGPNFEILINHGSDGILDLTITSDEPGAASSASMMLRTIPDQILLGDQVVGSFVLVPEDIPLQPLSLIHI